MQKDELESATEGQTWVLVVSLLQNWLSFPFVIFQGPSSCCSRAWLGRTGVEVRFLFGMGDRQVGQEGHPDTCWDRTSACSKALMEGRLLSS